MQFLEDAVQTVASMMSFTSVLVGGPRGEMGYPLHPKAIQLIFIWL